MFPPALRTVRQDNSKANKKPRQVKNPAKAKTNRHADPEPFGKPSHSHSRDSWFLGMTNRCDKWKPIIVALTEGNRRFNEMQRLIEGISAKVLSTELKDLELNGFVRRNVFTGTPVMVEYELTEYAETLGEVLQALSEWGAKHKEMVKKSMHLKEAVA